MCSCVFNDLTDSLRQMVPLPGKMGCKCTLYRNPFANALFISGRRVEGNSNALSCLQLKGRSDVPMERVRN